MDLADAIRDLRQAHRPPLSQAALARAAGIAPSYISRLESGERSDASPDVLIALAGALGVSRVELLAAAGYLESVDLAALPQTLTDAGYRATLRRAQAITDTRARRAIVALIREFL